MLENQKVQKKKQGERLRRNETKISIIEFILSNKKKDGEPGIPEPKIREFLDRKYRMTNQDNIRKHLKDLLEDACLEKFPYKKPGLSNHWDITKIKHLSNIKIRFPYIQMNKYEKSILIELDKNGIDILTFDGIQHYVRLLLSSSFFNACIDTNFEILYDRAQIIYAYYYPLQVKEMEATLEVRYSLYKKSYPNLELSFESFKSLMTQMTHREELSGVNSRILKNKSWNEQKPFAERFMKIWEEELLGISKEMSNEMHRESVEDDLRRYWKMNLAVSQLKEFNNSFERKRNYLLFEHYLHQDILDGNASEEEINYAIETRANKESNKTLIIDDNDDETLAYLSGEEIIEELKQACIILNKYKQPSIFIDFYKDPSTTSDRILEFFNKTNDQVRIYVPLYRHGDHDSDRDFWDN